jgi:transcriptional regulator with XRE-family HTH domain
VAKTKAIAPAEKVDVARATSTHGAPGRGVDTQAFSSTGRTPTNDRGRGIDTQAFASRLRARLHEVGASQVKLAEALGVSRAAVGWWCTGHQVPSPEHTKQAAAWLGVSLTYLEYGQGPKVADPALDEAARGVKAAEAKESSAQEALGQARRRSYEAWRALSNAQASALERAKGGEGRG